MMEKEWDILPIPPMTLRDWFAGQALTGLLANPAVAHASDETLGRIGEAAYRYADQMIAERVRAGGRRP